MRDIPDKSCRENTNTRFVFNNFLRKSFLLWNNLEKYSQAGQVTDDNMAHAHCKSTHTHTHTHTLRICNTYCFSTATMVTWMCLSVMLCLPVCSLVTSRWSNRSIYTHNSRSYRLIQVEFNQISLFTNNPNCQKTELCKLYLVVLKRKHFPTILHSFHVFPHRYQHSQNGKNGALKQMIPSLLVAYG